MFVDKESACLHKLESVRPLLIKGIIASPLKGKTLRGKLEFTDQSPHCYRSVITFGKVVDQIAVSDFSYIWIIYFLDSWQTSF